MFDSYEEAKVIANAKNGELYRKTICFSNMDYLEKNIDRINEEFAKEMELCSLFEKASLEATSDMSISVARDISIIKNLR